MAHIFLNGLALVHIPGLISRYSLHISHATILSKHVNYMAECPGGIKRIRKMFWNRELTDAFLMSSDKSA